MGLTTGARKSELTGLTWLDIDFTRKLASLHDSKNGEPRRLPLVPEVVAELRTFQQIGNSLIFSSDLIPTKQREFRKVWKAALQQADITNFRFHDLRHSCATILAQNNATLFQIRDVLGHASLQSTKRYAHLCIGKKQELVNDILGGIAS